MSTDSNTWPPTFVSRLNLTWTSPTTIEVFPGWAIDSTNTQNLTLDAIASASVASGNAGALGGLDQSPPFPGTVSGAAGNPVVKGTGTNFLTAFGPRPMTGSFTSSGTTVTGSGSRLKSRREVAINDLVGNATVGYYQVASVGTDSSLVLSGVPKNVFKGASLNCIEHPVFQCGSQARCRVKEIASNLELTLVNALATAASGLTASAGGLLMGVPGNNFYYPFLVVLNGVTGVVLSTQRTAPYLSGITAYRRIGSMVSDANGNIHPFVQDGDNNVRTYQFLIADASNNSRCVNGEVGSGVYVGRGANAIVPPTATVVQFGVSLSEGRSSLRPANSGIAHKTACANWIYSAGGMLGQLSVACDGGQEFEWLGDGPNLHHIDVSKYTEVI